MTDKVGKKVRDRNIFAYTIDYWETEEEEYPLGGFLAGAHRRVRCVPRDVLR